jgi:tetratricopeptide (TPR) repeat protein
MSDIFEDFDLTIAACTMEIEKTKKAEETDGADGAAPYLKRGIARCFNPSEKDDRYSSAIEDLSVALAFGKDEDKKKALYYRAYAYYLSNKYESAITDCDRIIDEAEKNSCATRHLIVFTRELLGLIYASMGLHLEASKKYKKALPSRQTKEIVLASPLLMDAYRNARAHVKSV